MSASDLRAAEHERARELAAARQDEVLSPSDAAWLADHLDLCDACAAVAADYDAQHDLFGDLRAFSPEPPRDLWARTAAAIDAERGRRSAGWRRLLGAPRRSPRLTVAPLVAVVAVVVIVGAGLLNGSPAPGVAPGPTPFALAAADVQLLARDSAGNVQILTRPVDAVCPVEVSVCGVSPTFAVTAVSGLGSSTTLQGAMSPAKDRLVVVTHDAGGEGVYVLAVRGSATPSPSTPASPAATHPATTASVPPTSTVVTPSAAATGTPPPADSPVPATATPSEPAATPSSTPDGTPAQGTPSPAAPTPTEAASPAPSAPESALPPASIDVSPAPNAAIQIASGVTVVGSPLYAPDGAHLAFAAMPTDGSTGPDIYVWAVGDKQATPVTSDHGSWLAAWTAAGIIASRVADGTPAAYLLDPATGHATPVGAPGTWLPVIAPSGTAAVWWSGTTKLAADGVTWVPDAGKVVVGAWPSVPTADATPGATRSADATDGAGAAGSAPAATPQTLTKGQVAAWQARWDETGDALAIWVSASATGHGGKLSLYQADPATGAVDPASPMLNAVAANPDFSLRSGRLAWTTPSDAPPQVIEVLAWSGKAIGRLELPADGSGTVVP